jgi:hypothetical protein
VLVPVWSYWNTAIDDGVWMIVVITVTVLLSAVPMEPEKSKLADAVLSIAVPGGVIAAAFTETADSNINRIIFIVLVEVIFHRPLNIFLTG